MARFWDSVQAHQMLFLKIFYSFLKFVKMIQNRMNIVNKKV